MVLNFEIFSIMIFEEWMGWGFVRAAVSFHCIKNMAESFAIDSKIGKVGDDFLFFSYFFLIMMLHSISDI